ncbi:FGGY-family carbohydrate kinase [Dactylosporangium sp. CA-152071]|uniref:FGGY-family carbohydrate kinase n=1 Tax=Dactylosporangium sp. CA-152071 TaxID=3239933 RepID=UPI003D9196FA
MSLFLGVDIGTTRTKVGCYDAEAGRLIALYSAPTEVSDDAWGGRRDPAGLTAAVAGLLRQLLDDPAVRPQAVAGIGVGSVGEEVVMLGAGGEVTAPVPAWFAGHGREAKPHAGEAWAGVDDTFSVFKLLWLDRAGLLGGARTFTSLADFVARDLLADPSAPVFLNVSHASRTGLLDVRAGTLDEAALPSLGLGALRLPALTGSATVVGHTSGAGVLPRGVAVVTGGHDHMCGAFGSGVRKPGDVYVSAGTSEAQVLLVDALPERVDAGIDVGVFVAGGLRYLHRATPSGRFYQSWRRMLYAEQPDDVMWSEVDAALDTVGPAGIDSDARTVRPAALPMDVTRAQAMASLLKGLAVEADATTTRLGALGGTRIADVTVAGVAAGWAPWRRLRQDATARRLRFVAEPEATVLGVAALARLGVTGAADVPTRILAKDPAS